VSVLQTRLIVLCSSVWASSALYLRSSVACSWGVLTCNVFFSLFGYPLGANNTEQWSWMVDVISSLAELVSLLSSSTFNRITITVTATGFTQQSRESDVCVSGEFWLGSGFLFEHSRALFFGSSCFIMIYTTWAQITSKDTDPRLSPSDFMREDAFKTSQKNTPPPNGGGGRANR